jgi:hypothetical protein
MQLPQKQQIRFARIEKPTASVVVAFLVEEQNGETVIVSEPKIVKIIPKKVAQALRGTVSKIQKIFALGSGKKEVIEISTAIPSPYVSEFFKALDFTPTIYARPPTATF